MSIVEFLPYLSALLAVALIIVFYFIIKSSIEKRIGRQFRNQIERHYDEIENIYSTMRGWRHDFHNHIQTLKAHVALKQFNELDEYLNKLDEDLERVDTRIRTGNIMVDAILNSKVSLAENNGIDVNVKAIVDARVQISEIDICVISGN